MLLGAVCTCLPGVDLRYLLADLEAFVQCLALRFIIKQSFPDARQADALNPRCCTFQVVCLLTVHLGKGATVFKHLFLGIDLGLQVGDTHLDAAVAADMQFITGVHTDHAKVFNSGLGTVARAAGNGQFVLVWHP
jgi:hypothetical protein